MTSPGDGPGPGASAPGPFLFGVAMQPRLFSDDDSDPRVVRPPLTPLGRLIYPEIEDSIENARAVASLTDEQLAGMFARYGKDRLEDLNTADEADLFVRLNRKIARADAAFND